MPACTTGYRAHALYAEGSKRVESEASVFPSDVRAAKEDTVKYFAFYVRPATAVALALACSACGGGSRGGPLTLGGAGVSLTTTNALVAFTLQNEGKVAASDVVVNAVQLGAARLASGAPITVGALGPGVNAAVNATLTKSGLQDGMKYPIHVSGTVRYDGTADPFTADGEVAVPPASPGKAPSKTASAPSHTTSKAPYPHRTPSFTDEQNGSRWTVPIVPNATPVAPAKPASKPQPAPSGDPGAINFKTNDGLGINGSTTAEPSGATGNGVTFMTSNWYAAYSNNGGTSFTQLDPTTIFPNDAIGYCCDQIVQYVPSIDRIVWLLQGNNGMRLAEASPAQIVSSNGTSWTYWNLPSTLFSEPSGSGYDYPDLSVGTNYLYMSWDACWPGNPSGCNGGREIVRGSLSDIKNGGTLNMRYTTPSDSGTAWGSHLSQDTGSEIFWAGQNNNTSIRVFSWPESSTSYSWTSVSLSAWPTSTLSSTTPDKQDWMNKLSGFPGNAVIGATVSGGQVWLAWSAGTNNNFAQPHVEMAEVNPNNNFSLSQQVQIWNASYAYGYPALATDACTGEVGLSLEYGGGGNYENHVVGFWGDFVVYITTNSNQGTTRYGDYVTIRQDPTSSLGGSYFDAFGYGLDSGTTQTDTRYVVFGRPKCTGR